ncbi:hypothetical protein MM1218R_05471 [Mycobacterium marinum]|nr:hypothetical protein MM1218R_05471 [Mycobacterium marinum]AXN52804.1 hypothetical protein CCUG20998_05435 [Mycobacterium marinum]RFZ01426.1 hypothetical protein DE4381_05447 [Mycobacterium marinum]RFZ42088.1 hypothetical protein MSS4_04996 [Mycobacterium marinum]CDM79447.1 hypothetical protein MMARE11_52610 [Mycobacterium marinum E11]
MASLGPGPAPDLPYCAIKSCVRAIASRRFAIYLRSGKFLLDAPEKVGNDLARGQDAEHLVAYFRNQFGFMFRNLILVYFRR